MQQSSFPVPEWVGSEDHQRFAVALAALYHNHKGSIADLSAALGMSHYGLGSALNGGGLTKKTCLALEALLGRDRFPAAFFRPDLFEDDAQ